MAEQSSGPRAVKWVNELWGGETHSTVEELNPVQLNLRSSHRVELSCRNSGPGELLDAPFRLRTRKEIAALLSAVRGLASLAVFAWFTPAGRINRAFMPKP